MMEMKWKVQAGFSITLSRDTNSETTIFRTMMTLLSCAATLTVARYIRDHRIAASIAFPATTTAERVP